MLSDLVAPHETSTSILLISTPEQGDILRFERNGDIYVKGKLIENDHEIVDGFRSFLKQQSLI